MEVDCIWRNLENVGQPFFKFTVCQFIHDFANERLLVRQFDV